MPRSWEDCSFKLGENVFEFLGNYLLVALACVCCVLCAPEPRLVCSPQPQPSRAFSPPAARHATPPRAPRRRPHAAQMRALSAAHPRPGRRYKHPVALIGILVTSKAWDWLRKQEGGADAAPAVGNAAASPGGLRSPGSPRGGTPRTPGTPGAAALPPPRPSRLQRLKGLAVSVCACPLPALSCAT